MHPRPRMGLPSTFRPAGKVGAGAKHRKEHGGDLRPEPCLQLLQRHIIASPRCSREGHGHPAGTLVHGPAATQQEGVGMQLGIRRCGCSSIGCCSTRRCMCFKAGRACSRLCECRNHGCLNCHN